MKEINYNVLRGQKVIESSWCYEYQLQGLKDMLATRGLKLKIK